MKKIYLLLFILLVSSNVFGQDIDPKITEAFEEIEALKREYDSAKKDLTKQRDEYKRKYQEYKNIKKNNSGKRAEIDNLTDECEQIRKEIEDLTNQQRELDKQYNELYEEYERLAYIRDEFIDKKINSYDEYIVKPLSEISTKRLGEIKYDCEKYNDNDAMQSFINGIDNITTIHNKYVGANDALNQKFNREHIAHHKEQLEAVIDEVSIECQKADITRTIELLDKYEIGVKVLIYVVDAVKVNFTSNYSYFDDDVRVVTKKIITEDHELAALGFEGEKIANVFNEYVLSIPHLKKLYETLKKRPRLDSEVIDELEEYKQML